MTLMTDHERPDIAEVLRECGSPVPDRSGWISIKCPFHDDSTASASVNRILGKFKCHACDVKGDAYDLIKEQYHCSFKEALTIGDEIAQKTGRSVKFVSGQVGGYEPLWKARGRRR